ncbi:MAG: hypothetical protein IJV00_04125 [Clostridia bacterium]|nr:hypothetical protein [Clostridia bacterium]
MKKLIAAAAALLILLALTSCADTKTTSTEKDATMTAQKTVEAAGLSGNVTISEWFDKKGEGEDFTVTVKLVELLNPYYARVEDESGSVLLFGLWENGEPRAFEEKDVAVGDTIVVRNPVYNVYEGNVEMKEGTLAEKK